MEHVWISTTAQNLLVVRCATFWHGITGYMHSINEVLLCKLSISQERHWMECVWCLLLLPSIRGQKFYSESTKFLVQRYQWPGKFDNQCFRLRLSLIDGMQKKKYRETLIIDSKLICFAIWYVITFLCFMTYERVIPSRFVNWT
jgi:hypothetical protein